MKAWCDKCHQKIGATLSTKTREEDEVITSMKLKPEAEIDPTSG